MAPPNNEKNQDPLSAAREKIHDATKSPEQKQQEEWDKKNLQEKVQDKMPNSAEEALGAAGSAIDSAATNIKKKVDEQMKKK